MSETDTCSNCSPHKFTAERLDVWRTAHQVLKNAEDDWPDDYGVDPRDVLVLAYFLAGELPPI